MPASALLPAGYSLSCSCSARTRRSKPSVGPGISGQRSFPFASAIASPAIWLLGPRVPFLVARSSPPASPKRTPRVVSTCVTLLHQSLRRGSETSPPLLPSIHRDRCFPQPNAQLAASVAALALRLLVAIAPSERASTALVAVLRGWQLTRRLVPVEEDTRCTLVALSNGRAFIPGTVTGIASSRGVVAILMMLANALTVRGLATREELDVHGMSMLAHLFLPFRTASARRRSVWSVSSTGSASDSAARLRSPPPIVLSGSGAARRSAWLSYSSATIISCSLRLPARPVPTTLLDVDSETSDERTYLAYPVSTADTGRSS